MRTIDETIEVSAPADEVWSAWADVERLPAFMEGVESVRREGDDRLEWRARLDGDEFAWSSRITDWEPGRVMAWASEEGTTEAGGRVELSEAGEGRTRVHVTIDWPSADMVEVSLERLRDMLETERADG